MLNASCASAGTRFCFGFRAFLGKRRARGDDRGDRPDRADRFGIDVAGGLAVDGDFRIGVVLRRGEQRDIDVCGELPDGRRLCVRRGEDRDGAERFADVRCAVAGILLAADAEQRAVAVSGRAVLQRDARPVRAGVLQNPDRVAVGKLCGDDGKVRRAAVQRVRIVGFSGENSWRCGAEQERGERQTAKPRQKTCSKLCLHKENLRTEYYIQYYFT